MADVVFVCVREDVRRAEALADAFDRAGFSVETQFSDDALDECAAGVIVLSSASARCDTFVEAAHWVIDSGKAVVASLVQVPRTAGEPSQIFDLSAWDGDAGDLALEPMICAIDRLVIAARAPAPEEVMVEVEPVAAPAQRWGDLPPLELKPMAPRASPVTPRAYLPVTTQRRRVRLRDLGFGAAVLCAVLISGFGVSAFSHAAPAAHAVTRVAAVQTDQAPIEPVDPAYSAPVVSFGDAVAIGARAETVAYTAEPPLSVLSPSRAEPPSAERALRDLHRAHAAPRARAFSRPPAFIDGVDGPA